MDINSIISVLLPIVVFVVIGLRLLAWALSSVLDVAIVPEKTQVVKGSLKHGIMATADAGLKMAGKAKAAVKDMLSRKGKAKTESKDAPTIIEYRILGKHKGK